MTSRRNKRVFQCNRHTQEEVDTAPKVAALWPRCGWTCLNCEFGVEVADHNQPVDVDWDKEPF